MKIFKFVIEYFILDHFLLLFKLSFLMSIEMNALKKSIATTNQRLCSSALAKIRSSAQHL